MVSSRRIIAFVNVAHVVDHSFMLLFPTAVLGMGRQFDRPYGALIALSLGSFIAFGAGALPAGWLGDRWSQRNMMAVFFIGIGLATIATGFATTPFMLASGLTAIGLFASIYHPVGTAMLVSHADRIGQQIGVNGVWGNLGVAFAALVAGALTQWLGWQWAFWLPGVVYFSVGLLYLLLVPAQPNRRKQNIAKAVGFPRPVIFRAFVVLAFVTLAGGVTFNASTVALPKLFAERVPVLTNAASAVGIVVCGVYVIGAMSQLIVGRVIDHHPLKTAFLPLAILQAPFLLITAVTSGWWTVLAAIGAIFAIFGQVTINDGMVAKYADAGWMARVYAVRYSLSFGVTALAVPLVAYLHDHGGFITLFKVLSAFGALVFLGAILFPYRPDELEPDLKTNAVAVNQ
jgi:MFS family permease